MATETSIETGSAVLGRSSGTGRYASAGPGTSAGSAAPPAGGSRRGVLRIVLTVALVLMLVLGVAAYWALDRYVIDHVQIADVAAYEATAGVASADAAGAGQDGTGGEASSSSANAQTSTVDAGSSEADASSASDAPASASSGGSAVTTDDTYTTDSTSISITKVVTGTGRSTVTYYVADVVLADATDLRSAFAQNEFGTNIIEDTSDIAAENGAIFAINGDYYGFRDTGILIRNGVVYRDDGTRIGLAIYLDGRMEIYDETETSAEELLAAGVWNTLSFGPALVDDGRIVDGIDDVEVDTNFGNHSIQGTQPRTGLGMIEANHFVFVVADGRSPGYSRGVTMTEFAQIFQDLGCQVAYNLDGGGSSTMYFNGQVVNDPLGKGRERGVSDILYVGA